MAIRAKREGRINVWPNSATALLAGEVTPLAEVLHKLTVYDRSSQAIEYQELEDEEEGGVGNLMVDGDGNDMVDGDGNNMAWAA